MEKCFKTVQHYKLMAVLYAKTVNNGVFEYNEYM